MTDFEQPESDRCRCCSSPDPRTIHGEFIQGMCSTCSDLIVNRMTRTGETIQDAIDHFEETNVLAQLRELRAEAEGREIRADGPGESRADHATPRDWGEVRTDDMNGCFAQNCPHKAEKAAAFESRGVNQFVGYCAGHYREWLENRSVQTDTTHSGGPE